MGLIATAVASAALMIAAAVFGARPRCTSRRQCARECLPLLLVISCLAAVAAMSLSDALDEQHLYGPPTYCLPLGFGALVAPFVFSIVVFRVPTPLASLGDRLRAVLWACVLAAGTIAILVARWRLGLHPHLSELAGVWLVSGLYGFIWTAGRALPQGRDPHASPSRSAPARDSAR
jgi:hypothetical protein